MHYAFIGAFCYVCFKLYLYNHFCKIIFITYHAFYRGIFVMLVRAQEVGALVTRAPKAGVPGAGVSEAGVPKAGVPEAKVPQTVAPKARGARGRAARHWGTKGRGNRGRGTRGQGTKSWGARGRYQMPRHQRFDNFGLGFL